MLRDRVVERLDVQRARLRNSSRLEVGILDVPAHREIGAIDLQHEAGVGDRLVFVPHRLGDGVEIGFLARVMVVAEEQRDHARRSRAHEAVRRALRRRARP